MPAGNSALTGSGSQPGDRSLPQGASGNLQPSGAGGAPGYLRWASRYPLKNWRVRSRLLLLVAAPTLAAVILGGFSVSSSISSAFAYQRVQRLASLTGDVTDLVQALQNEREDTVTFITMAGRGGRASAQSSSAAQKAAAAPELGLLNSDYAATNQAASPVRSLAASIGSSYPALAQQEAQGAITAIDDLQALRQASAHRLLPALTVIDDYGNTISQLLSLENEVAAGSSDAALADNVRALSLISNMKEEAAQQQAILTSALHPDLMGVSQLGAGSLSVFNDQADEQAANLAAFNLAATAAQRRLYDSVLSPPSAAQAQQQMQQASSLLDSGTTSANDPAFAVAAHDASFTVSSLRSVEKQLVSSVIAPSGSLRGRAIATAIIGGIAVALVLVLALLLSTVVGRSMTRPLRKLRTGALEVAGVRLPEAVRQMSETDGEGLSLDVRPIDVDSTDEIGEVARAFDQVHREALRLAANEAALRGNVNAMFVNLSRRSQSLVERQIRLIDELEQGEQDSERLSSLFQMDHLATRMRRNSENLLVLAGHDVSRRWNQPVPLVDVLRAAVSEIEQFERVTPNVQPGIAVRGQAVSDVVHLTAELVENATSFSPADTPVSIVGHLLSSGGVLLEIADQGVGMGSEELAHANWRLDNPPVVDVAVSRRMGLFVVARLAARHGIRVRLRPAGTGGLTALVWLPDEVVTQDGPGSSPGDRPFDTSGMAPGASATSAGFAAWVDAGRSAAEQEVNAARIPRFAPLRADAEEAGAGQHSVPGAGAGSGTAERADAGPSAGAWADATPDAEAPADARPDAGARADAGPDIGARADAGPDTGAWADTGVWAGAGPDTGRWADAVPGAAATGPMPVLGTSPQPAGETVADQEPAAGIDAAGIDEARTVPPQSAESPGTGPRQLAGERDAGKSNGVLPAPGVASERSNGRADKPRPSPLPVRTKGERAGSGRSSGSGRNYADAGGRSALGDPAGPGDAAGTAAASRSGWSSGSFGDVVVPPAAALGKGNRLPIFEAVESDWFRGGRRAAGRADKQEAASSGDGTAVGSTVGGSGAGSGGSHKDWASAADEGWRAAEAVSAPSSSGMTPAGLPKRVPQANLVPGAAEAESAAPTPARSAAATRERLASFQRGIREARAAAASGDSESGEAGDSS
ncbi:MAG TPA: nitrate- and nitrite sensing domain-containing protein [Streptosporangiaceae bacterium]|nr:nitrate- and nitrite sensing domain-containing protein [Streptosporangiaceae bacterium]